MNKGGHTLLATRLEYRLIPSPSPPPPDKPAVIITLVHDDLRRNSEGSK